ASSAELPALQAVLADAAALVAERFGDEVTLEPASDPHGGSVGVVVTSADGRTLYDNRVDSRLRRHENEVRRIVYDTLFSDTSYSDAAERTPNDGVES
ncbi:MAG: hypothetical protein ACOCRN_02285, partial [Spirochaetia bacterium]